MIKKFLFKISPHFLRDCRSWCKKVDFFCKLGSFGWKFWPFLFSENTQNPWAKYSTVDVFKIWKYGGPHTPSIICANEMKLCVYNAYVLYMGYGSSVDRKKNLNVLNQTRSSETTVRTGLVVNSPDFKSILISLFL